VDNENKGRETVAANAPAVDETEARTWQPIEFKGNRLQKRKSAKAQKRLGGSYFAAFSTNRIIISLQNRHNLPSPVTFSLRFFKSHRLPARQVRPFMGSPQLICP
jgi:hypothetical protein